MQASGTMLSEPKMGTREKDEERFHCAQKAQWRREGRDESRPYKSQSAGWKPAVRNGKSGSLPCLQQASCGRQASPPFATNLKPAYCGRARDRVPFGCAQGRRDDSVLEEDGGGGVEGFVEARDASFVEGGVFCAGPNGALGGPRRARNETLAEAESGAAVLRPYKGKAKMPGSR